MHYKCWIMAQPCFECKVVQSILTGDHTLYVAEVLSAMANPEFYEKKWKFQDDAGKTLHYLGGNQYAAIGETFKARTLK